MKGRAEKQCAECGNTFTRNRKFGKSQWAVTRFCSTKCSGAVASRNASKQRRPLRTMFEERFSRGDGCWEWSGTIEGYGYGVLDYDYRRYRAHVLALEFDNRPVKPGMVACHHCDNPRCVRPDHLYVGTPKDNANDASRRNRLRYGSSHHHSKLDEKAVETIRREYSGKHGQLTSLARKFGVTRPTISKAIRGETWVRVQ